MHEIPLYDFESIFIVEIWIISLEISDTLDYWSVYARNKVVFGIETIHTEADLNSNSIDGWKINPFDHIVELARMWFHVNKFLCEIF